MSILPQLLSLTTLPLNAARVIESFRWLRKVCVSLSLFLSLKIIESINGQIKMKIWEESYARKKKGDEKRMKNNSFLEWKGCLLNIFSFLIIPVTEWRGERIISFSWEKRREHQKWSAKKKMVTMMFCLGTSLQLLVDASFILMSDHHHNCWNCIRRYLTWGHHHHLTLSHQTIDRQQGIQCCSSSFPLFN